MFHNLKRPLVTYIVDYFPIQEAKELKKVDKLFKKSVDSNQIYKLFLNLVAINKNFDKPELDDTIFSKIANVKTDSVSVNNLQIFETELANLTEQEKSTLISQFLIYMSRRTDELKDRLQSKTSIKYAAIALSSIYCHFRAIKWKSVSLTREESEILADALIKNRSVKELDFNFCSIDNEMLGKIFRHNNTIQSVKFTVFNFFKRENTLQGLTEGMRFATSLKSLNFTKSYFTCEDLDSIDLFLQTQVARLDYLAFDQIELDDNYKHSKFHTTCKSKAATFLNLLKINLINDNSRIKELSFKSNIFPNDNCSIKMLSDIIRFNTSMIKLDLGSNSINEVQRQALKAIDSPIAIQYISE